MIRIRLRGVHIITMQWGKVYSLDVFEDSQAVAAGLAKQGQAGLRKRRLPRSKADFKDAMAMISRQ